MVFYTVASLSQFIPKMYCSVELLVSFIGGFVEVCNKNIKIGVNAV